MPAPPRPGTPEHRRLVELVRSRREFSERYMSTRYPSWRESEQQYRAFVDPDARTKEGKKQHPYADSIVVPLTFALMQTQLAFDMTAFTQRSPVVPLDGVGPEDVKPAKLMEQLLHHEWQTRRMLIELYTWLLDRRRYGLGILWNDYRRDLRFRTVEEPKTVNYFGIEIPSGTTTRREPQVVFEGNRGHVVDPFKFWPDPRVPLSQFQDGEFVGHTVRRSYSYLLQQQAAGFYHYVDDIPKHRGAVRKTSGSGVAMGADDSDRDRILNLSTEFSARGDTVDFQEHGYVDLDEFVMTLQPKRYGLAGGDDPQKWWVTLANDAIVTRANPFEYDHDEYPVAAMEASLDAHAGMNPGNPEILKGMQDVMSWLFNSHIESVKKILNDMLVVNPGMVELKDLLTPQAGRLIRVKREFYQSETAARNAIQQLDVTDVTRSHMTDMQAIIDFAQRISATPENLQGVISEKDRTLGEQQMAVTAASGRLKIEAQLAWVQGMVPWNRQRVQNIQQFMSEDRAIKIVGEWPRALGLRPDQPFVRVAREEIQGQFTYEIIDGSIRQSDQIMKMWHELFQTVAGDQELRMRYDLNEIFRWLAIMGGASNIDDFILQGPGVQVAPDEMVARMAQQGNLVPAGTTGRPVGPKAIPGIGRERYADAA